MRVEVAGRAVEVIAQRGRGLPLVLCHGASADARSFDALRAAMPGRALYALSYPGRGGSEGPPLEDIGALASFVLACVRALELPRFGLLGHSMGGAVALEAALQHDGGPPLERLVLVSTGARLRVHPSILAAFERAAETNAAPRFEGPFATPELIEAITSSADRVPVATSLADWRAANGFDRMNALRELTVPTIVASGEADALTPPKYARYLAEHLQHVSLYVIPEAGHMLHMQRPSDLAVALSHG